jgi:hypothetical protein
MDFCSLKTFVIRCEDWAVHWLQVGHWGESVGTDHSAAPRSDERTWYRAQLLVDDYADIFPCLLNNLDKQYRRELVNLVLCSILRPLWLPIGASGADRTSGHH